MKQYVIIGNGTAAVGCIEGIRSVDTESAITVISEENHHVYGRPLISYYLENKTTLENMKYRPDDFYEKNNCTVLYGVKAESIDSKKKVVTVSDGSKVKYDSLCIATGSSPFVPPFEGLDTVENKYSFMTLDDALAVEKAIDDNSEVLIVGAGLIGLKCAEGIINRVRKVTVCDLADRVLSSILDNECASRMQSKLEEHGVNFMLGDTATKFDKDTAYMKSGKEVYFDVLILAVGVRANISLAKEIGCECERGITVNTMSQTSVADVYSAGDCTECVDYTNGAKKVIAILPNAYLQGNCAGKNMAGEKTTFENSVPMNSIGFFGLHAMSAGSCEGDMYEEKDENNIKRFFTKDGYLTGFMIIGNTERTGIYTSLVRNKTKIDEIDFEIIKKYPSLIPFGENYRKDKLGGVV